MFSSSGAQVSSANYIEDVFSTWLYTGSGVGTPQTITNGIDLSGKGGLVWIKNRTGNVSFTPMDHYLFDTLRGVNKEINTNKTDAEATISSSLTAFNSNGFSIGSASAVNYSDEYAAWTFREQAKFFDVVTYTGNGSDQNIAHNLGSVPGFVVIKRRNSTGNWSVYHRSIGNNYLLLNSSNAQAGTGNPARTVTSTTFQIYGNFPDEGANGGTYVMYLFAHDAGGFGASGSDNVISCGSYMGNGSTTGPVVTLGYEPQWLLIKKTTDSGSARNWWLFDSMRGLPVGSGDNALFPNTSAAESTGWDFVNPTSTGFNITTADDNFNTNGLTYIYIAIRRGPMKTPTSGTSVFQPTLYNGNDQDNRLINTTIAPDMVWVRRRVSTTVGGMVVGDRLRGQPYLLTGTTAAEVNDANAFDAYIFDGTEYGSAFSSMNGYFCGSDVTAQLNTAFDSTIAEAFKRAPGFFDMVCWTGTGVTNRTVNHNLGVAPELMILKSRSDGFQFWVTGSDFTSTTFSYGILSNPNAITLNRLYSSGPIAANPSSTQFTLSNSFLVNGSTVTYVAYLFASCPGVSKVGSYTGTGTTQQINCGFTGGARFVLIKRADSSGDWYVWDSARGIVAGNDPYLLLNSTAAEVTNTDYVDTFAAGFEISSTAPAAINANGGTFIFLAIA